MTQSPNSFQNISDLSPCKKNHMKLAIRLCLILLIPFLGLFVLVNIGGGSHSSNSTFAWLFWFISILIFGFGLREAVALIRGLTCCKKGRGITGFALCLMPWAWCLTWYAIAPGFLVPFFNNRITQIVICTAALWQILGVILLIRVKSNMQSFLVVSFFILSANCVLILCPLLGPVLITIFNALWQMPK
jgi:hypothetical protein